jgi:sporulation protein YlmC with PRC-barrel domain
MDIAVVRDLLDKQLVDRDGEALGRVDGIIMAYGANAPPRITHFELGAQTLARRLPRPFRIALSALALRLTPRGDDPYRIEVSRIVQLGRTIKIDIDGTRSAARETERWIRDHVIARIPGS